MRTLLRNALERVGSTDNILYSIAKAEASFATSYRSVTNIVTMVGNINRIAGQAATKPDEILVDFVPYQPRVGPLGAVIDY